jgi:hypothetical protein
LVFFCSGRSIETANTPRPPSLSGSKLLHIALVTAAYFSTNDSAGSEFENGKLYTSEVVFQQWMIIRGGVSLRCCWTPATNFVDSLPEYPKVSRNQLKTLLRRAAGLERYLLRETVVDGYAFHNWKRYSLACGDATNSKRRLARQPCVNQATLVCKTIQTSGIRRQDIMLGGKVR